jgi:hypothetical protein
MSRAGALIGLFALLLPAGAHGQAPVPDVRQPDRTWPVINLQLLERNDTTSSATRPDFFLPRNSTAGFLKRQGIYQVPDDILTAAFVPQNLSQAYPSSLDVADRVVTVWLVRSLQDSNTGSARSSASSAR